MKTPEAQIAEWRRDPVKFAWDVFRFTPDAWQKTVMEAFPKNQRIAMQACKGPGKTALLAILVWNFLVTRMECNIAVLSITRENLMDGLWKELAKWRLRSDLLTEAFEFTKTKIYAKSHPDTWWVSARSFAKDADAQGQKDSLAGLHMDYIMVVMDESGGIPPSVSATAEAVLSSCVDGKILQAGNPTDLNGALYAAAVLSRDKYFVVEITGDPDDPNRSPRISVEWARQQIEMYGRDNPWVLVNVFGKFPPSSMNTLIDHDTCHAAQRRRVDPDAVSRSQRRLGVDVARFGDDRTVIQFRQGLYTEEPVVLRNLRSNEVAARVVVEMEKHRAEVVYVDDTGGHGAGVIDCLIQRGIHPVPVNFGSKADDPRYYNKRSEMWFRMSEWLQRGGALPRNGEFVRELTTVTYTFQNERFLLEDKKQLKSRLGFSPDLADALAMTFYTPELPSGNVFSRMFGGLIKNVGNRIKSDYDPLAEERWND